MESNGMNRSVETLSELVLLLREKRVEIFERICGRHWLNTTKFQCYDASAGAPIAVNVIFQSAHNQPSRRNRPRRSNYLDNPEECKKLRCSSRSNEEQATMAKKRIRRSMSQKGDNMFILVSPANPNLLMNFQLIYNELDNIMNVFIKQVSAILSSLPQQLGNTFAYQYSRFY
ncbi:hypothetical protein D918_09158 [Trichuris suis]|nr:hypothetical protein D918_09158 [Trichuris suis]